MKSDYQTLRQLQFKAHAHSWQDDKREAELSKLLADFVAAAIKYQDCACARCLATLDADNIEESVHATYVHRKCPSTRAPWYMFWRRWTYSSRYLRRYGLR